MTTPDESVVLIDGPWMHRTIRANGIALHVVEAGTGAGMFAAAAVLVVFALIFGLIALAEGLVALHLWRWVAYLIVFILLLLLAGLLGFLGFRKVKKVKAPQQTIDTTKSTVVALRQATSHQPTHRA